MDPMPISIGKVYYSFLNKEFLGQEQVSRRDSDLECYDRITEAIAKLPEAEKCGTLTKGAEDFSGGRGDHSDERAICLHGK